jgi:aspartate racemase
MIESGGAKILGVLGGMGPLASAEFMRTIYEHCAGRREQDWPRVVLDSDPSFPDRTEHLLAGTEGPLLDQLVGALRRLRSGGASPVVICCVTIHHLLPRVPEELRRHVVSLLDVIFDRVAAARAPHLLLCTKGTRQLRLFESHRRWPECADFFVLPAEADQEAVHEIIYRVKAREDVARLAPLVEELLAKYGTDSFVVGCTETHILAKHLAAARPGRFACVDPLAVVAESWAKGISPGEVEPVEQPQEVG